MRPAPLLAAVISIAACAAAFGARAEDRTIALFPVDLISTSLEPIRDDEIERLTLVWTILAERLEARGFVVIDARAAAEESGLVRNYANLAQCNGCERRVARALGADLAGVAWVQKVSNLILNVNLRLREADGDAVVRVGSVDIRGNDDQSWSRGARFLIDRRMYKDD